MVLQGAEDTLAVTMDDMVYHSRMVSRACRRALVVADMPYRSYDTGPMAYENACKLMETGAADVVKLEGGVVQVETVASLTGRGIPVCGHVGLQPQSIKEYGGYKVQGRTEEQAERIMAGARALEAAGACMVVLECIPASLARQISNELAIPTIGIGAGVDCDGQVLVIYDVLGLSAWSPRMAKKLPGRDREHSRSCAGICPGGKIRSVSGTGTLILNRTGMAMSDRQAVDKLITAPFTGTPVMETVSSLRGLRSVIERWKRSGYSIALVPTMGKSA